MQAVVQVVLDQGLFGLRDGFFHGLQLLCDIQAGLASLQHLDNACQMPASTPQAFDDRGMGVVGMHLNVNSGFLYPPPEVTVNPLFEATGDHTQMTRALRFNLLLSSRLAARCALVSLVFLLGALITPRGLVTSPEKVRSTSRSSWDC